MTGKRIIFLQKLLSFLGLEERLHLAWISSAEAQRFVQVVTEFTEKLRALGPSPVKGQVLPSGASALAVRATP
jgi:F420-non-reducing hydrogenase iron-sulfur subunit